MRKSQWGPYNPKGTRTLQLMLAAPCCLLPPLRAGCGHTRAGTHQAAASRAPWCSRSPGTHPTRTSSLHTHPHSWKLPGVANSPADVPGMSSHTQHSHHKPLRHGGPPGITAPVPIAPQSWPPTVPSGHPKELGVPPLRSWGPRSAPHPSPALPERGGKLSPAPWGRSVPPSPGSLAGSPRCRREPWPHLPAPCCSHGD